jgi:hypothetical protein
MPDSPYFNYNLACVYAETRDAAQALKYLEAAKKNSANIIKGEKMPDATTDSSFAGLREDPGFQRIVKDWPGAGKK